MAFTHSRSAGPVRPAWPHVMWWVVLAAMLTIVHVQAIDRPQIDMQIPLHDEIVRHQAPAPYNYRLLQPVIVQAFMALSPLPTKYEFVIGYAGIRFISFLVTFGALWLFARRYMSEYDSLVAVLLLAAVLPFTFLRYHYQPTSVVEAAIFAVSFLLIANRKLLVLAILTAIATLNRETMVFISVYWFFWHIRRDNAMRVISEAALLFLAWSAVFVGLRLMYPAEETIGSVGSHITFNLTHLSVFVESGLILVPVLVLALADWSLKPQEPMRLLLAVPLWLAIIFLFGRMNEVRLFVPMLLPALPLVVLSLRKTA